MSLPSLLCLVTLLSAAGCGEDGLQPEGGPAFTIQLASGDVAELFTVEVATAAQAAELQARLDAGAAGVIIGDLVAGDGGFNQPWSWHLDPATVHAVDVAVEVCDGRPSMVEQNLSYWLGTVGSYCPWGAEVVERLR